MVGHVEPSTGSRYTRISSPTVKKLKKKEMRIDGKEYGQRVGAKKRKSQKDGMDCGNVLLA